MEQEYIIKSSQNNTKITSVKADDREEHWKCLYCKEMNPKNESKCKRCNKIAYLKYRCLKCRIISGGKTCAECGSDKYIKLV